MPETLSPGDSTESQRETSSDQAATSNGDQETFRQGGMGARGSRQDRGKTGKAGLCLWSSGPIWAPCNRGIGLVPAMGDILHSTRACISARTRGTAQHTAAAQRTRRALGQGDT